MWKTVGVVAPMLLGMMVVGLLVEHRARSGFKPTSKKLKPDFGRLNVFKGIKKMVGMQAWWELGQGDREDARCSSRSRGRRSRTRSTALTNGSTSNSFAIAGFTAKTALTIVRNVSAAGLVDRRRPTTRTRSAGS